MIMDSKETNVDIGGEEQSKSRRRHGGEKEVA